MLNTEFLKAGFALTGAVLVYSADRLSVITENVPSLINDFGFPSVFIACLITALVCVSKALKESQAGRLEDRDKFIATLQTHRDKAEELHKEMITATQQQSAAFEKQSEAFERQARILEKVEDKLD